MKAQQAAIKEEASANNLSDTSQEAQEIQEAKKEAQAETDKSAAVSNEELKASTLNVSKEESQAERLANAAKQKQAKLTPGSKESQLTEALFAEKSVAKNDLKEIPQLVTKMNDVSETETVNTDNKDTVKQKEAKFENGVITRKADEKQLIIQLLTRNQVNNLKTTPSNKRNASKASTNKTSGQKKQHNKKSSQGAKKQSSSSKSTQKNNQTSNKNSKTTNAKSSNASKIKCKS